MFKLIGLDFETYCALSLPDVGLFNYVNHPTFKPLLGSTREQNTQEISYDFVLGNTADQLVVLQQLLTPPDVKIVAHNALFEQQVLDKLGLKFPSTKFVDSAVIARVLGAGGSLEAAAPQLLPGQSKLAAGRELMRLFSFPGQYQELHNTEEFHKQVVIHNPDKWKDYSFYCRVDAELGLEIAQLLSPELQRELDVFAPLTMVMNNVGWPVDLALVEEMQRRYLANLDQLLAEFRLLPDTANLNLNSLPQLKKWCADRGVRTSSFAELPLERLRKRLVDKLNIMPLRNSKGQGYAEVLRLVQTKQALGGSSLKKLQVILDTAVRDPNDPGRGRLHDQYLHAGAGQTLRTTGRSAQMQNLKRLDETPADMSELDDASTQWNNDQLAENIRQVFTASDPKGYLIVGDFKSVESRGLAWMAGEDWKVDAYFKGKDIYKETAANIYSISYDAVTKLQRQTGKVGELSCGYGAGAGAVVSFAAGMGVTMSEGEASKLVYDWRDANPYIVKFWENLDHALKTCLETSRRQSVSLEHGYAVFFQPVPTPVSLRSLHQGAQSVSMSVVTNLGETLLTRYFHGCYIRGRNVCYYKPSARKTGDLWKRDFIDPKTKQLRFYELYGGKLAGILTQSLCREIFMHSLQLTAASLASTSQVQLIGQFHDEIVLDWQPGSTPIRVSMEMLEKNMSTTLLPRFPLAADIKWDYRYTK